MDKAAVSKLPFRVSAGFTRDFPAFSPNFVSFFSLQIQLLIEQMKHSDITATGYYIPTFAKDHLFGTLPKFCERTK